MIEELTTQQRPRARPGPARQPDRDDSRGLHAAPARGIVRRAAQPLKHAYLAGTSSARVLPDFIIIGAQKAGTTSLYEYLTAHPAVMRAETKEVHYFDVNYARGLPWYRRHFPTARAVQRRQSTPGQQPLAGEASPYYLFHPQAPYRVRGALAEVKLIVLLRDPVERAISHHHHSVATGVETLSLEEAIEREPARLEGEAERLGASPLAQSPSHRHHSYVSRGEYARQLEVWLSLFERDQMLILDSGALFADPGLTMHLTCDFLGLTPTALAKYPAYGARDYGDAHPEVQRRLRQHFAPHNRRLWELIGDDYGWEA